MITERTQHPIWLIGVFTLLCCFASLTFSNDEPVLPLESIAGKDADIYFKDHNGEVLLIDFWASWCGPCRQSFPWMNAMQAKYSDKGLTIIAINLDSETHHAYAFLEEVPANFLLGFDPEGLSAEKMNVEAMPMSYLINRQGKIVHRMIGFNTEKKAEHEAQIQALLDAKKSSE